jgi:hypothetical protein
MLSLGTRESIFDWRRWEYVRNLRLFFSVGVGFAIFSLVLNESCLPIVINFMIFVDSRLLGRG